MLTPVLNPNSYYNSFQFDVFFQVFNVDKNEPSNRELHKCSRICSHLCYFIIKLKQQYFREFKIHTHYFTLQQLTKILQMRSKSQYRQIIQNATRRIILFPHVDNKQNKPTVTFNSNIKLPSSYSYRLSQQIESNMPITKYITHQSTSQHNEWPKSCIGLALCEHRQNNQTYYVYGTGILINKNIVFTSASNVYCRRLTTQYTNIRFIVGVNGDKCSGIYDVKRVHYPKEYTMQEGYENYNFAVLQLYDDLSKRCGYVGWKTIDVMEGDQKYTEYGYIHDEQEGFFNLRYRLKHEKQQQDLGHRLGSGILIYDEIKYYVVGLQYSKRNQFLSDNKRNKQISGPNLAISIYVDSKIDAQACKQLSQVNETHLTTIDLARNNIGAQGCKYLSQATWTYLTTINLFYNYIGQGCKYLSEANWNHLTTINLKNNNICVQCCKFLSQANWNHLTTINLESNNICAQGCKYLSQANWIYLTTIYLHLNKIGAQGCKYLSQANWTYLTTINLQSNNIGEQGCKYLRQANWKHLTTINLTYNYIKYRIYRVLLQYSQLNTSIYI